MFARIVRRLSPAFAAIAFLIAALCMPHPRTAHAYVEIPYTLGRLVNESTNIVLMRVESVDKATRRIVYKKVRDLKGAHNGDTIKHQINNGFEPREPNTIMAWAEVGKMAVFCYQGGASETCIEGYWYQAYAGDWWSMSHSEPFLGRSFHGKPEKLAVAIEAMIKGQEVIVPAMMDGDKNAMKTGTARVQRMKASLKLVDYNAQRDFVGWGGNDDFKRITGMPGFMQLGQLPQTGPGAGGIAPADFNGDGKIDLCLFGETRTVLLQNEGNTMNEVSLPYSGPSRAADWADYNGDGKPDLLLATPTGPRLFTNMGEAGFKDDSRGLPQEHYYNLTAAAFIDADKDGRPDILLANGFLGLRLYRNIGPDAPAKPSAPKISPWHVIGPFENAGGQGFDRVYPPEKEINLKAQYDGKGGNKAAWKEARFADGQANSLMGVTAANDETCIYVYRELDFGAAVDLPVSLGSDDTLTVFLNGEKVHAENVARAVGPDQAQITLKLKAGKNQLLMKICNGNGDFAFYFAIKGQAQTPAIPLFEDASDKFKLGPDGAGGSVKGDRLIVSDVNGDGRSDFLYSAGSGTLVLNTPGGFVEARDSGIRYATGKVTPVLGDVDGDKLPDLLVPQAGGVKLFLNAGNGRFSDVTANTGDLAKVTGTPTSIALADFKKTGKPDVIIGCLTGPNRRLRNLGTGKFADASDELGLHARVFNTRGVYVGDINKNGALDLVFNNEGQDSAVLIGDPDKVAAR
ncbi:MAG: VCBS repeat-containing protein [Phycisphaeraceae bacterium]